MKAIKVNRKHLVSHHQVFAEKLKRDPEFRKLWEAGAARRAVVEAVMGERIRQKMSQKELAERAGIRQPHIARLEGGGAGMSIDTLAKIAKAFGARLKISFETKTNSDVQLAGS